MRKLAGLVAVSVGVLGAGMMMGCGATATSTPVTPPPPVGSYTGPAFGGKVLAGTVPVIGATVQIYSAGTTGNGSAPQALLATTVTTDSNGAFSVAGGYTCPLSTSVMYAVATGGHAGSGAANGGIVLMTSPGACSTVTTNASYVLNEATTVASAYAFAQFLKAGAQLGASSTNASGITLAAATLANLVNVSTGGMPGPGFPANGTAPVGKLGAIADALNACITSSGAGSSACSGLYSASVPSGTPPGNTLDAAVSIAQHPGVSATGLYQLSQGSGAYAGLTAAPADWTLFVPYTGGGMSLPTAVAIDSMGKVWVVSYNGVASYFTNTGAPVFASGVTGNGLENSYGGAVDANDVMWVTNQEGGSSGLGTITLLTSAGTAVTGSPYQSGGLDFPTAVAIDATNVSWIADFGDSHLTLLSNSGTALSGTNGYSGVANGTGNFSFPVAVAVDGNRFGWVANQTAGSVTKAAADGSSFTSYDCAPGAAGVAVDAANNVWVAGYSSSTMCLVSAAGSIVSGSGFVGGGLTQPEGVAVDGGGTAWVVNYRAPGLTELAGAGTAQPGQALSPANGWAPDTGIVEGYGVAVDASGNLWVSSYGNNTVTEFVGLAVPVKTPLLGPVRVP